MLVSSRPSFYLQKKKMSTTAATAPPPATAKPLVYVKGDPEAHKLLDCPFSHRVLLAMEEKGLERDLYYVDEYKKQEDFLKASGSGSSDSDSLQIGGLGLVKLAPLHFFKVLT